MYSTDLDRHMFGETRDVITCFTTSFTKDIIIVYILTSLQALKQGGKMSLGEDSVYSKNMSSISGPNNQQILVFLFAWLVILEVSIHKLLYVQCCMKLHHKILSHYVRLFFLNILVF